MEQSPGKHLHPNDADAFLLTARQQLLIRQRVVEVVVVVHDLHDHVERVGLDCFQEHLRLVPGDSNEPYLALSACLFERLQRAVSCEYGLQLRAVLKGVNEEDIHVVGLQADKTSVEACGRSRLRPLEGLGRKHENCRAGAGPRGPIFGSASGYTGAVSTKLPPASR